MSIFSILAGQGGGNAPQQQGDFTPQQQMGWGDVLRTLGVPLAAAIAGTANKNFLPAAAGLSQGYSQGVQNKQELGLKQQKLNQDYQVKLAGQKDHVAQEQARLEKQAGDYMNKVISYRSGGLGLQDSKVNQAIDLRNLIDQNYDPQTNTHKIPPAMQTELVLGLARMISPTGQVGVELEKELAQKTAKEGLAKMMIYFGADPKTVGGSTEDVIKSYIDSIDRQGMTAEGLRDNYTKGLKTRAEFTGLDEHAKQRILNSNLGSSFKEYMSHNNSGNGQVLTATNPKTGKQIKSMDGGQTWQ